MATHAATNGSSPADMPLDGILLAEELLDLAERAQSYTNATGVVIALARGGELLVRTSTGNAPEVGTVIPATDALIGECLERRKSVTCRDVESDSRIGPLFRDSRTRSLIAIPIPGQPGPRGVMVVIAAAPGGFQPTHSAILTTLCDIVSSKLAAREDPPQAEVERVAAPAVPPETASQAVGQEEPVTASRAIVAAAKPQDAPHEPAISASAAATPAPAAVPAVLLKPGPLPLVEEKKQERDPGLLSTSEDPGRFQTPRAFRDQTAAGTRPEPVKTAAKPVAPVAATSTRVTPMVVSPKPVTPVLTTVKAVRAAATTAPSEAVEAQAPAAAVLTNPAVISISSWETPAPKSGIGRFLVPVLAAAAVLVVGAVLWIRHSTKPVSAQQQPPVAIEPVATRPSDMGVVARPAAAVGVPMIQQVAKVETVAKVNPPAKSVEEHPPSKPAAMAEPPAAPTKHEPRVIEIAAGQPRPVLQPEADTPAPKLNLASGDSTVATLSKVAAAIPAPPASQLVPAMLIFRTAPVYPSAARLLGIAGKVELSITIASDGSVRDVQVISGAPQLRNAATDAVRHWRYKPATLSGKAVESNAQVQINFTR